MMKKTSFWKTAIVFLLITAGIFVILFFFRFRKRAALLSDEGNLKCSVSIRCDTVLNNLDKLDKEKQSIVPSDGVILPATEVSFHQGDSAFDALYKIVRDKKIHMEFSDSPMYNAVYIEGISNLYEFDCGELSGWMYSVNGYFPNYGISLYELKDGDVLELMYTCDLGDDVGNSYLPEG